MKEFVNQSILILLLLDTIIFFYLKLKTGNRLYAYISGVFFMLFLDDVFTIALNTLEKRFNNEEVMKYVFVCILIANFTKIVFINLGIKERFGIEMDEREKRVFFAISVAVIVCTLVSHTMISEIIGYLIIYICLIKSLWKVMRNINHEWDRPYNYIYMSIGILMIISTAVAIIQDIVFGMNGEILHSLPRDVQYYNAGAFGIKVMFCILSICIYINIIHKASDKGN